MFQLGALTGKYPTVEHRNSDGSWGVMAPTPEHHDPSQHDPENEWRSGKIFRCDVCEEEVRNIAADDSDEEETA